MDNLKPCPFCGNEPRLVGGYYAWIQCDICGAHQFAGTNVKDVIDRWNNRAEDKKDERI